MKAQWNTPAYFETATAAAVAADLARGADPGARNRRGATPLHHAVSWNRDVAVIGLLLAAGADLQARNEYGETPLHLAVMFNDDLTVIEALLSNGANPDIADELGETPLHRAAATNDNPAVIERLLDAGADPTAMDSWARTPGTAPGAIPRFRVRMPTGAFGRRDGGGGQEAGSGGCADRPFGQSERRRSLAGLPSSCFNWNRSYFNGTDLRRPEMIVDRLVEVGKLPADPTDAIDVAHV